MNDKLKGIGEDPDNPVRLYCDGVFDMFHIGHSKMLEQAKRMFKHVYLIAGVSGDEETWRLKGRTVMDEFERTESVRHCKWVDEVICPCPWTISLDFLNEHNIDYVCHDDIPYGSGGSDDIYAEIKKAGKFLATQRTEGISTSDLILRIIKDYDKYIWRSLERGYSPKDLGISYSKAFRIKLREKTIPDFVSNVNRIKGDIRKMYNKWENTSSKFFDRFLHRYGKEHVDIEDSELSVGASSVRDDESVSNFDY